MAMSRRETAAVAHTNDSETPPGGAGTSAATRADDALGFSAGALTTCAAAAGTAIATSEPEPAPALSRIEIDTRCASTGLETVAADGRTNAPREPDGRAPARPGADEGPRGGL